jgi:simple sugar transport system substrate-binding protein
MEQALGAQVMSTVVESVAEGPDSERVMRDLASQGHGLVFATSFGYLEPTLRVAADFPNVRFEHAGGYKTAPNVNTYNARYYEGRYLAGWLAGKSSRSGIAGYVAGFPVPEVIQGINAFALGMREANPKAQVKVLWLDTWFDPAKEREAALALVHQGADVLTNHSASPAVAQAAEELGVQLVAYQSDMRRYAPHAQLTSVVHQWGGYYTAVAKAVLAGTWKPQPVWGGMKDGFIALAPLSERVPKDVAAQLDAKRRAIIAGSLKPFSGRLVDNTGKPRLDKGALDDAAIASMNWFVQGVIGTLPKP